MRAVWMVRRRQISRKLTWWLEVLGYDTRDRTLGNRVYQIYVTIFWSVWFFAVFGLLAGPASRLLHWQSITPPDQAASLLSVLVLLVWALTLLWQATRRSPFVFSENDAHIICQAPVPRASVALAWLAGAWLEAALPFWAGAASLSIALVDMRMEDKISLIDLPTYLSAGLQAMLVISFVHFGLMALVWAVGAWRLQGDRQLSWQPGAIRLGIFLIGLILVLQWNSQGLEGLSQPLWQILSWPLVFPLKAAFGAAPFAVGFALGLAWAGLGTMILTWASAKLNLSRAAQETTQKAQIDRAPRYGQSKLLSGGHTPSRVPARAGEWMLVWKDVVQSQRAFSMSAAWGWFILLVVSVGFCLLPDLGGRGLALALWAVIAGQRLTSQLQKDLCNWTLLHLLPFSSARLLLADMVLPWALVVLLGWMAIALAGGGWILPTRLSAALLLPFLSASVAMAAAYDLLRQSHPDLLLNGSAPQVSSLGGLLGILCLALTLSLWFVLHSVPWLGSFLAAVLATLLTLLFWQLASRRLRYLG